MKIYIIGDKKDLAEKLTLRFFVRRLFVEIIPTFLLLAAMAFALALVANF